MNTHIINSPNAKRYATYELNPIGGGLEIIITNAETAQ